MKVVDLAFREPVVLVWSYTSYTLYKRHLLSLLLDLRVCFNFSFELLVRGTGLEVYEWGNHFLI